VRLPADVAALVASHTASLDERLPGVVEALYLVGSVALGDYRPGMSDVDFVAIASRPLGPSDRAALAAVHGELAEVSATHYDGCYVNRARLATLPVGGEEAPHSVEGEFRATDGCAQLNPVTWMELRQCGVALRGPAAAAMVAAPADAVVRSWLLDNLQTYWLDIAALRETAVAGKDDREPFEAGPVLWGTLGPPRLHYTLAQGSIVSKTEAGRYAAAEFPGWTALADRCVRARAGEPVSFTVADAGASAALIRRVVADAVERWGGDALQ
jgi:hypothetical protein